MEGHDAFFQRIIGLIPRELYKADEEEELNTRYFKHKQVPLAPAEKKIISQKRKHEKYGTAEDSDEDDDKGSDDEEISHDIAPKVSRTSEPAVAKAQVTPDVRARLREKLEEMSKKRKRSSDDSSAGSTARVKADKKDKPKVERNHQRRSTSAPSISSTSAIPTATDSVTASDNQQPSHQTDILDHASLVESMADVEFSAFTAAGARGSNQPADFGKPGSKMRRLKRMLEEADAKRRRLELLNQSGEAGKMLALGEQWSDALKDVSGGKSVTDTTKLRKAIKKREKDKEKSSREWADRIQDVADKKNARLDKREKNLLVKKGVTPSGTPASAAAIEAAKSQTTSAAEAVGAKKPLVGLTGKSSGGLSESDAAARPRPGFEGKGKTGKGPNGFLNSKGGAGKGSSGHKPSQPNQKSFGKAK